MPTLNGYFFYASVQKPVTKFQKENSKNPLDFEYKVDVLVNANDYKEFTKKYKQQKKQELPDRETFVKRYGMEPPSDIKPNADGEYCFITLKTNNAYKDSDGEIVKFDKPKVLFKQDNGKLKNDPKTLVGNGSKGVAQYIEYENKQWNSKSGKLTAIRVDELVPYAAGADISELGELDEDSFDEPESLENELGEEDDGQPPFDTDDDDKDEY